MCSGDCGLTVKRQQLHPFGLLVIQAGNTCPTGCRASVVIALVNVGFLHAVGGTQTSSLVLEPVEKASNNVDALTRGDAPSKPSIRSRNLPMLVMF